MRVTHWQKRSPPSVPELKRLLAGEGLDFYEWKDDPGTRYGEHTHSYDEIRWVVTGTLCLTVSGKRYLLGPGDRLDLPANTSHSAEVVGNEAVTYLCASTAPEI